MHLSRAAAAPGLALTVLLGVCGCTGGAAPGGPAPAGSASAASSASSATPGSAGPVDACALVPAAPLAAAIGADPGEGTASTGTIGGSQCTWKVSDTHRVVAQVTPEPDAYLPDGVLERPDSAADVPGADRGFAAAESHTILVVKHGRGLLLNDIGFSDAEQPAYDALAEAVAARM